MAWRHNHFRLWDFTPSWTAGCRAKTESTHRLWTFTNRERSKGVTGGGGKKRASTLVFRMLWFPKLMLFPTLLDKILFVSLCLAIINYLRNLAEICIFFCLGREDSNRFFWPSLHHWMKRLGYNVELHLP